VESFAFEVSVEETSGNEEAVGKVPFLDSFGEISSATFVAAEEFA